MATAEYDAVIVGSGPNGLAAAITLCKAGLSTLVVEARATPGGGARSESLTLPGFVHDVCSTVHPLGVASPFLRGLELQRHGVDWIFPPSPVAHVVDERTAVVIEQSLSDTALQFGHDGPAYLALMKPFVERFESLLEMILAPARWPSRPLLLGKFGLLALRSLEGLAHRFRSGAPRALLAGMAAHAMQPLDERGTASFALVLGLAAHAVGWPIARGGSQAITQALVDIHRAGGGELQLSRRVTDIGELPRARAYLFDVTPRQLLAIAGAKLPASYRARLARFRYGPGIFKMDWALSSPIPWRDQACARSATVHLSGSLAEVAASERAVAEGNVSSQPFVIVVQPSLFDASRAPLGRHTAWAYCHVPHASTFDAESVIEAQIERFAPGFKDCVLARVSKGPAAMEIYNENYVGGDINGGAATLGQLFARPVLSLDPYATPAPDIFFCSSSTPPGGGVHGMCGYWAARSALRKVFGRRSAVLPAHGARPLSTSPLG